jgi:hypothetical protein
MTTRYAGRQGGWPEFLAVLFGVISVPFAMYALTHGWVLMQYLAMNVTKMAGHSPEHLASVNQMPTLAFVGPPIATSATALLCAYTSYRALDGQPLERWARASCLMAVGTVATALLFAPKFFPCITYC